ncbi:DUF4249 domain-containing protein [Mucilaginibacter flavus]|uniref:DUF4249 domain-containing protein n=1 Tax=Mucilaginibacter flavus TaxID=931504 RepID=UPI0025B5D9CA|nr:DUF4249 domain-containing protein [Mucilaginibacter flavus]MDN3583122.1 DUF4249 domain-containing protein [Mucilaginibacter flavus]
MKKALYILIGITIITACKKQIPVPVAVTSTSYLVFDGHIAVGDSTFITLSRTVSLTGNAKASPELGAKVSVEGKDGSSYALTAKDKGSYVCAPLNLSGSQTYRLKIITSSGKQYLSDYVPVKNSPPVDSVNYQIEGSGLSIKVNTHDAANNTKYYRWDYINTYQVQSKYESKYIVVQPDTSALRTPEQQVYNCWVTDSSSTIILGSSAKLSEDKISNQEVAFILPSSEKLRIELSVLVKQYALTSDAFNYYDLLKKNSGQVGGVFDPQPSELTGNIHSVTNSAEPVIGYVTIGAVTQKRIFIYNKNLPASWLPDLSFYDGCAIIVELYDNPLPGGFPPYIEKQVKEFIYTGIETPIDTITKPYAMKSAKPYCVDCTLRGTNKKPLYWK